MAKQSTHAELQRLLEVAKRDIPTGAEVEQLQLSVLGALRAGAAPQSALPEVELPGAPHSAWLLKTIVSMGMAGLLAAGAAGLRSHWRHAAPAATSSLAPNISGSPATGPTLGEALLNERLPTASVSQGEPQQVPTDRSAVSSSSSKTPAPQVQRAAAKPPLPEAELIERARAQLQNSPAQALVLTKRHRHLYPNGLLAQEREVIAIEALARLGKSQAAQKRAEAFRAAQPNSIHDLRLRSALGDAGARRAP
jgi:hypothetical protein